MSTLHQSIAALSPADLDAIRDESTKTGLDFHKLVVMRVTKKPYEDILPEERMVSKNLLFNYLYSSRFPR